MDELNIHHRVEVERYPRRYAVERTPMIRLYQSSPVDATLQLRGEHMMATVQYLTASDLRALITKLLEILRAIDAPPHRPPFNMFEVDDAAEERGSEG